MSCGGGLVEPARPGAGGGGGCTGARGKLPYLGCALKVGWATESATSAPHASERGPPTGFTSGRIPGALNAAAKKQ